MEDAIREDQELLSIEQVLRTVVVAAPDVAVAGKPPAAPVVPSSQG